MGLDMYIYKTAQEITSHVDFEIDQDEIELVHQWRKHPNMHGMMEAIYRFKGGKARYFNCVNVLLTNDDLDLLEKHVRNGELPDTAGFFFGFSDGSEKEDDLLFISLAREVLSEGKQIFYHPWW